MLPIRSPIVAVDVMSGDRAVEERLSGVVQVLAAEPRVQLELIGRRRVIGDWLAQRSVEERQRISVIEAADVIGMGESISQAVRGRPDSSIRRGIERVSGGHVDACVSCGNTGALVGLARLLLKSLPGVDRPALCASVPAIGGHTWALDLGANVHSGAEQLVQFAAMGSALASAVDDIASPRVGLINIGSEHTKGSDSVRQAGSVLANSQLNYIGFVEGGDLYSDRCDVAVCDGFTGNVALKASEGVIRMMQSHIAAQMRRGASGRMAGWLMAPALRRSLADLDPRNYNGACLLGLDGIVVKGHGNSDADGFAMAIRRAAVEVERDVNQLVRQRMTQSGQDAY
jgi:glycerol-3-phosphate acyltransferase PlsX